MIKTKVYVSKRSILAGEPEKCASCPVALAIRKTLKLDKNVKMDVGYNGVVIIDEISDLLYKGKLPTRVALFIRRFDSIASLYGKRVFKKNFRAFSFYLELEEPK